ncbi:MAG: molybdenum cofactor biosynthesis protein MoaE [Planctomycetes bacterium]|nr:molybdenum cofactor biosynthesis protein MoaE [Planctomycetota bacterium]
MAERWEPVEVQVRDGPLDGARVDSWRPEGAGAVVVFEGIVRSEEDGRPIEGLEYEAYEPMAGRQMERICRELIDRYGLIAMRVAHSRGLVPVGACSFRLWVASAHRKEALQAMDAFIDMLKQDVPIWKRAVRVG